MSFEGASANPAPPATSLLKERYEVGERLAEGTFFHTHRGQDLQTQRPVAVKVLRPEFAADDVFVTRLLTEAQSATRLHHPNISRVYDVWREHDTVIIVCEWVRGINLRDRIRRVAPFPLPVATDILHAAAEGLHYAHENGYIHGDLRPSNLIITPDGRVKLTDFGLGASVAASRKMQLSALEDAAGYLAPELTHGSPPDVRSDIYALGCMLYEMLTGNSPFAGDTPLATAVQHLQQPVPSVRTADPTVPVAIDGIARKCMQKDPMARYLSVQGLADDLRKVQEALREDRPLNWSPLPVPEAEPVPAKSRVRTPEPPPRAVEKPAPAPRRREREEPVDSGPSWMLLAGVALLGVLMIAACFGVMAYLTRTPGEVTVPYLIGKKQSEAVAELQKKGLKAEIHEEFSSRSKPGVVYKIVPDSGVELRVGKSVSLFVSRGSEPITVPDVVGKKLDDAKRAIRAAGLGLGKSTEEFSELITKGEVISQAPSGGSEATKATPIELTVSKGPEPIPEPKPEEATSVEPILPDGFTPAPGEPDSGASPDSGDVDRPSSEMATREHEVTVQVPQRSEGPQKVRIVVRNEDGSEQTAYENEHEPGETVREMVTTQGAKGKCQIRVYLNGRLVKRTPV
jgi:serine/threonine-protein kinase